MWKAFLILCPALIFAQSTSPWKRIGINVVGDPQVQTGVAGATYMTVMFRAAAIYQNSNFYTNFVEANRQAVLTVQIDGSIGGNRVQDTKVGKPIDLKKNKSLVGFGSSLVITDRLPTTFGVMSVTVSINKTSQDGLKGLLDTIASISSQTPGLAVSQSSLGVISASKTVADYLFGKQLLEQKLSSPSAFSPGVLPQAGVYVCFAGDAIGDYESFLGAPVSGHSGLLWNGSQLTWDSQAITANSYFIVEIGYQKRVFSEPMNSLSYSPTKPWAALFQVARQEVNKIVTLEDGDRITSEIRSHLSDAATLLDTDPDYIRDEKDSIESAVKADVQDKITKRMSLIAGAAKKTTLAGSPFSGETILLNVPVDDDAVKAVHDYMNKMKVNGMMLAPPK